MTNSFINTTVETSSVGQDAFDMSGNGDSLLLASSGSLVALGANADGLSMQAIGQAVTLDGLVYSAAGNGVLQGVGTDATIIVNGEVDSITEVGVASYGNNAYVLVNGSVYGGGLAGLLVQGASSDAIVNGTVTGVGVGIDAEGNGETVHVNGTVGSLSTGGFGIEASATNQYVDIGAHADVFGPYTGVEVGGLDDMVKNSGHLSGGTGVFADESIGFQLDNDGFMGGIILDTAANTTIQNSGVISSQFNTNAIVLFGPNTGTIIENAGSVHGDLAGDAASAVSVQNTGNWNGQIDILASVSSVTNDGQITRGLVFGSASVASAANTVVNDGTIHGGASFFANSGGISGDSVTNAGTIFGGVTFNTAVGVQGDDVLVNSGTINGAVTMGVNETLTNTGTIHGNVNFATLSDTQSSDIFDNSNGIVIGSINGGSSDDTFIIGQGSNTYNPSGISDHFDFGAAFGNDIIHGFKIGPGHDTISFSGGDFSSFAELQTHMTQVGANTVITLDAGSTIELTHTTIAHLVAADFLFG